MSKLRLLLLLPLASIVLLSARCRHCDPTVPVIIPFPEALKPYVDFGIGSYWVYEDSATGKLDSVVLVDKKWGWDEKTGNNNCKESVVYKKVEKLQLFYEGYFNGKKRSFSWFTNNSNKVYTDVNDAFTEVESGEYGEYILGNPITRPLYAHRSGYNITQEYIDTITFNSIQFNSVIKVTMVFDDPVIRSFIIDAYAKNIGLVYQISRDAQSATSSTKRSIIRYQIK